LLAWLACTAACTSDAPTVRDECRAQCTSPGPCDAGALEDYPSFAVTRADWASCDGDNALFTVAGACRDGRPVLATGSGFDVEMRIYADDESFSAVLKQTDSGGPICQGQIYWPDLVHCQEPVTTEVLCGHALEIGDPVFVNRWSTGL
jgi:hypothetical protein